MINRATISPTIHRIGRNDPLYPKRLISILNSTAPNELYLQGEVELLKLDGIGFCGSRDSSEKGLEIAKRFATEVGKNRLVTISGNARGVDIVAHFHALSAGGETIIVLPEGIDHFRVKRALQPVWDWERVLVISQFNPNHIWQSFRAMERNKIIVGLSKSMIVIEAKEKGGTMHAASMAVKKKIPLYAIDYENNNFQSDGNRILIEYYGAKKLGKKRDGSVNIDKVLNEIKKENNTTITKVNYEQFFLNL